MAIATRELTTVSRPAPLPSARGPVTRALFSSWTRAPHDVDALPVSVDRASLDDEDCQLALYVLYELHYRAFPDVDAAWEWNPSLLRERARLEAAFERALLERVGYAPAGAGGVVDALVTLATTSRGPSLSAYMLQRGTREQFVEFAIHRSAYQRKEADPHTWVIPRVAGRAQAALVEIQYGEYGEGDPERGHAELFARTMESLALDPAHGAYLDRIPATTLATVNLISLFGLHRRWRGSAIGHLALFEMCSAVPMSRYRDACLRLGLGDAAPFYDVHVEADKRHEVIALQEMVQGLIADEPRLAADVVFGARCLDALEARFTQHLLTSWEQHRSSLRRDRS